MEGPGPALDFWWRKGEERKSLNSNETEPVQTGQCFQSLMVVGYIKCCIYP